MLQREKVRIWMKNWFFSFYFCSTFLQKFLFYFVKKKNKLREEFERVQSEEVKVKLSERNCVEIVQKLVERGILKDLLHTLDGKEYVTAKQLDSEIEDEIVAHAGRMEVNKLQALLNVDISAIQKRVEMVVNRDERLQMIGSEIVADYYLEGVVRETREMMENEGYLMFTHIAERFSLPTKTVSKLLLDQGDRLATEWKVRIEEEVNIQKKVEEICSFVNSLNVFFFCRCSTMILS